ncbi:MAG: hypothetical protein EON56_06065 [Alphaproteobacteria bacterium]|nr:MAG: hypothetical protein EON56_06065 [Alphaproteobacteria bacterium]
MTMGSDNELMVLCQALVARRFESVHDAEKALERFEKLTTPAAVLDLIKELEAQREIPNIRAIKSLRGDCQDLRAENERLKRFETAYKEFSDKTDWVRIDPAGQEVGMHVADVLRKRCDDLSSHNRAQAEEIKALRAASTPQHAGHIPGGAIADDVTGRRVIVSGDAINRLKASHPRACVNAGLCEKIGQRVYTRVFSELSACGGGGCP